MDEPYKDPSTLTDEELDAVLEGNDKGQEGEPETPEVTEPTEDSEETTEEPDKESEEATEEPAKETTEEEPEAPEKQPDSEESQPDSKESKEPSPREAKRIQALIAKMKQTKEPVKETEVREEVKPINFRDMIDAPDEVYAQLEKATEEYGNSLRTSQQPSQSQDQIDSLRWETGLKIETPKVLAKYPQLNPDSSDFVPAVADAMNMEYLHTVGYNEDTGLVNNPNITYAEYVDARYELANLLADQKAQETTKNVVKQAASTGLRPDGSQSKRLNLNQSPDNMTDEELDAMIAQGIPTR